ncbi:hypothetical protein M1B35_13715 [Pseudomonas sp. MAFF 302046]|uniref:Uncharacterized protein n=1 Tax=Pseudomonas morbosilactucae TaxID=2938197 RepID=A0ABT0JGZ3_9PSED|nr:hypothetical protein [Pseudomonas morbosilactucae]MCK9815159.1 hypothetical protein [Pseudomonas morbosilactucae]
MTPDELHRYLSGTAHQRVFDHPLLYQLMTYGDGAKAPYRITNWNAYGLVARGLLTWLAQRTFNQNRFPWHPDTCFTEMPDKDQEELEQLRKLLADWSAERFLLEDACRVLREIYVHTQCVLASSGCTTIKLGRGLNDIDANGRLNHESGYATRMARSALAAERLNEDSFLFPTNVLSSWSQGGYGHYPVILTMQLPIESVLWGSATVGSKDPSISSSAVEPGEWVVANFAPDALLKIPVTAVNNKLKVKVFKSDDEARTFLKQQQNTLGKQTSMFKDLVLRPLGHPRLGVKDRLRKAWWAIYHGR